MKYYDIEYNETKINYDDIKVIKEDEKYIIKMPDKRNKGLLIEKIEYIPVYNKEIPINEDNKEGNKYLKQMNYKQSGKLIKKYIIDIAEIYIYDNDDVVILYFTTNIYSSYIPKELRNKDRYKKMIIKKIEKKEK